MRFIFFEKVHSVLKGVLGKLQLPVGTYEKYRNRAEGLNLSSDI